MKFARLFEGTGYTTKKRSRDQSLQFYRSFVEATNNHSFEVLNLRRKFLEFENIFLVGYSTGGDDLQDGTARAMFFGLRGLSSDRPSVATSVNNPSNLELITLWQDRLLWYSMFLPTPELLLFHLWHQFLPRCVHHIVQPNF